MKRFVILFVFGTVLLGMKAYAQNGLNEQAEEFIRSFLSEYKNPMAYYPLRRDIFLPTEEEIKEMENNYRKNGIAGANGTFIKLKKGEKLNRPLFVDQRGSLMFPSLKYRGLSKRSDFQYHKRKLRILSKSHSKVGQFLYYYSKPVNSPKK